MNLKSVLLITSLSGASVASFSQVTIKSYPKEISCEVGFTAELPVPEASSSCSGEIHITQNEMKASGGCAGTLIRSFTYADDCGNIAQAEQYVKLKDTEAPVLQEVPADIHLLKSDQIPPASKVYATDNSGDEVTVELSERTEKNVLIRTWSAVDGCDNKSVAVQKIHLP